MSKWSMTEARAKFEDICERAKDEGPQTITRYGRPAAVVLSAQEFEALTHRRETIGKASEA